MTARWPTRTSTRLALVRGVALAAVPDEVRAVTPDATLAALSRSDSG